MKTMTFFGMEGMDDRRRERLQEVPGTGFRERQLAVQ